MVKAVQRLRTDGFVNYFGMQRFGSGSVPSVAAGACACVCVCVCVCVRARVFVCTCNTNMRNLPITGLSLMIIRLSQATTRT